MKKTNRRIKGVSIDHGWLRLKFRVNGRSYIEYLGLRDTRENRAIALQLSERVRGQIIAGCFDFAEMFPNSKNVEKKPEVTTLRSFVAEWTAETKAQVSRETWASYESTINNHILPFAICDKPIGDIHDGDVALWFAELKEKVGDTIKARTINMALKRMRSIFKVALRRRGADNRPLVIDNPAALVPKLRQEKSAVDPFTLEEANALVDAADGWFKNFITLLLFTGMRPNEALALQWSDIDWANNLLKVRRSMHRLTGPGLPKTVNSEREIHVSDNVRQALSRQRLAVGLGGTWVFAAAAGKLPYQLGSIERAYWNPLFAKTTTLRRRTIYQCRHSYATMSLQAGENPYFISRQLGHSTVDLLYRVYGARSNNPQSRGALDKARSDLSTAYLPNDTLKAVNSNENE